MTDIVKQFLLLAPLLCGPGLRAAEFEVLDRFSVDGYSEFKSSATVPGGNFAVGVSTFVVKGGNIGIGTTNPGAKLSVIGLSGTGHTICINDNGDFYRSPAACP